MSDLPVNSPAAATAPPAAYYSSSVGRALRPRRALSSFVLDGARATWHAATRWIIAAGAALAALMVVTEIHQVCEKWGRCGADDYGPSHTLYTDHGATPLVMLAIVVAMQLGGMRGSLAARLITATGSLVVAFVVVAKLSFTHFLSNTEGGDGAAGCAALVMIAAFAQIVIELVLAARQRKAVEARDPAFPAAAVVTR